MRIPISLEVQADVYEEDGDLIISIKDFVESLKKSKRIEVQIGHS